MLCMVFFFVFFFKQKTAYEMRISDWSSDVCSSDLALGDAVGLDRGDRHHRVDRGHVHDGAGAAVGARALLHHLARRRLAAEEDALEEIGRASCREGVWKYV